MMVNKPFNCGLIGWPVAHSLSPKIHQTAFQATGLSGQYELYAVAPEDRVNLANLLAKLRQEEVNGLNVTIPYKQTALQWVDALSKTAQAIGAVNTLVYRGGKIIGENTDAQGLINHLQRLNFIQAPKRCLILGAGGSARAAAYSLMLSGCQVFIAARRSSQAHKLVEELNQVTEPGTALIQSVPFQLVAIIQDLHPELILNATPVGMYPRFNESPWADDIPFPENCKIYDLIYNPSETLLMSKARLAGLDASNGLGMLIEQAALSFTIWTGIEPPIPLLYQAMGIAMSSDHNSQRYQDDSIR